MRPKFGNRQRNTWIYSLGKDYTEVCKKTFMDTLDIKPTYLRCLNKRRDRITGKVRPSKRGKSKIKSNKISFKLLL